MKHRERRIPHVGNMRADYPATRVP